MSIERHLLEHGQESACGRPLWTRDAVGSLGGQRTGQDFFSGICRGCAGELMRINRTTAMGPLPTEDDICPIIPRSATGYGDGRLPVHPITVIKLALGGQQGSASRSAGGACE